MIWLSFAVAFALIVVGLSLHQRKARLETRRERLQGLELRPNCLLTRYPILFLSSSRPTLLRPFDHWNDIPVYLREHGYEILVVEPASSSRLQMISIRNALASLDSAKCHIVADSSQCAELEALSRENNPKIASLTLVRSFARSEAPASRVDADSLKPQTKISIEEFFVQSSQPSFERVSDRVALLFLRLNNLVNFNRPSIDPIEVAEPLSTRTWKFEEPFLNLAISLAERDARWSD